MEAVARLVDPAVSVVQDPPLGTGDAVRTGLEALASQLPPPGPIEDVLVLFGDTPLLTTETLALLLEERRRSDVAIVVAALRPARSRRLWPAVPGARWGDLNALSRRPMPLRTSSRSGIVNGGIMAIAARHAADLVATLDRNNAKSEFYLTDIVPAARRAKSRLPHSSNCRRKS